MKIYKDFQIEYKIRIIKKRKFKKKTNRIIRIRVNLLSNKDKYQVHLKRKSI